MAYISLTNRMKEIEMRLAAVLSSQDADNLPLAERELLTALKHWAIDARLEVRDYEYAETRPSQQRHAKEGKRLLGLLLAGIVKASEYNIFGPVDVAQLTAELDDVAARLT